MAWKLNAIGGFTTEVHIYEYAHQKTYAIHNGLKLLIDLPL